VRVRNLQSLDLDLPLGRLVGITGVSGAGKASLAFDTLFAEGRRRFVETLSTSARTLLAPIERPDADVLGGLPPAVAVRQRFAEVSPRPTLASTSDLTPLFRQLFSEAATLVCPHCQREVPHASPAVVARRLSQRPNPTRVLVLFDLCPPPVTSRSGKPRTAVRELAGSLGPAGSAESRPAPGRHIVQRAGRARPVLRQSARCP
jgi:excinuclease ABC subunit A